MIDKFREMLKQANKYDENRFESLIHIYCNTQLLNLHSIRENPSTIEPSETQDIMQILNEKCDNVNSTLVNNYVSFVDLWIEDLYYSQGHNIGYNLFVFKHATKNHLTVTNDFQVMNKKFSSGE